MVESIISPHRISRAIRTRLARRFPYVRPTAEALYLRFQLKRLCTAKSLCIQASEWFPGKNSPFTEVAEESQVGAVIRLADQFYGNIFDILGSGEVFLGNNIDWNADFKSGYKWDNRTVYRKSSWTKLPSGVDIKVPWELSRCHHFVTLGIAASLSGNPKYYHRFKRHATDWISLNPPGSGVNWLCPMDVGIRAINWITAVQLFSIPISTDNDESFFQSLVESLWVSASYIFRNLEWNGVGSDSGGNHLVADLASLVGLGLFFKDLRQGQEWLLFARKQLANEVRRQVNRDGTHFECSTYYHRLVLEMFAWVRRVCRISGQPLDQDVEAVIDRMHGFVDDYTSPSNVAAQIGDNDSGRYLTAGLHKCWDHSYLSLEKKGCYHSFDSVLLGVAKTSESVQNQKSKLRVYPDGGYVFATLGEAWLSFRAGRITREGCHSHCDQLAITLAIFGEDVLVDRGTGVYTSDPELRNRLRSSFSHSTLMVNDWELNDYDKSADGLFAMKDDTKARLLEAYESNSTFSIAGEHYGYERKRPGCMVKRQLVLSSDSLLIVDRVTGLSSGDIVSLRFTFRPGLSVVIDSSNVLTAELGEHTFVLRFPCGSEIYLREDLHSSAYGCVETATTATCVMKFQDSERFESHLSWKATCR